MSSGQKGSPAIEDLRALLSDILVDAHDDDEQLSALRDEFENNVDLPADGHVIGEPVTVLEVGYDGNERRGLTARCRRDDGTEHVISLADVLFAQDTAASRYTSAFRLWLGLDPLLAARDVAARRRKPHKAGMDDIDLTGPVDLVVQALRSNAVRCRVAGSDRVITLRATGMGLVVPGEVLTVRPGRHWRFAGHPYLSGVVEATRIDAAAIGLVPLQLHESGPQKAFELEQVPPCDPFDDPLAKADDLLDMGDRAGAREALEGLLESDLRCLDAHARLGDLENRSPYQRYAIRHYEVGVRIGELSLGETFDRALPWSLVGNRPFLRCLRGLAECQWSLGHEKEAVQTFERLLRLDPEDGQDIRSRLAAVRAGEPRELCCPEE